MRLKQKKIMKLRRSLEKAYSAARCPYSSFDELVCYELHSQPVNPRMRWTTSTGFCTGLTFKELAQKWGISVSTLGELIADHCRKLEG